MKKLFDCQIAIPDVGTLPATLEVRNVVILSTTKAIKKSVDCCFVRLDNQMNILLQRYISRLQSESILRKTTRKKMKGNGLPEILAILLIGATPALGRENGNARWCCRQGLRMILSYVSWGERRGVSRN